MEAQVGKSFRTLIYLSMLHLTCEAQLGRDFQSFSANWLLPCVFILMYQPAVPTLPATLGCIADL